MSGYDAELRKIVRERIIGSTQGMCVCCMSAPGGQVHHRAPRSRAKDRVADLANLILVCQTCHDLIDRHPETARHDGFLVATGYDAETVPVRAGAWGKSAMERHVLWLVGEAVQAVPTGMAANIEDMRTIGEALDRYLAAWTREKLPEPPVMMGMPS